MKCRQTSPLLVRRRNRLSEAQNGGLHTIFDLEKQTS